MLLVRIHDIWLREIHTQSWDRAGTMAHLSWEDLNATFWDFVANFVLITLHSWEPSFKVYQHMSKNLRNRPSDMRNSKRREFSKWLIAYFSPKTWRRKMCLSAKGQNPKGFCLVVLCVLGIGFAHFLSWTFRVRHALSTLFTNVSTC